jgi:hypothetical protein
MRVAGHKERKQYQAPSKTETMPLRRMVSFAFSSTLNVPVFGLIGKDGKYGTKAMLQAINEA